MKGIIRQALIIATLSLVSSQFAFAAANNQMNNKAAKPPAKMWFCETNASSSSNPADMKADDEMKKGSKKANSAFEFAFKHCRDCNKISCKMETA